MASSFFKRNNILIKNKFEKTELEDTGNANDNEYRLDVTGTGPKVKNLYLLK